MQNLLNVNQVAFILKVHPLTVRRYIKEGKIRSVKAGGNIRIVETDLEIFVKEFEPASRIFRAPSPKQLAQSKAFTGDDPLLRLDGRGASIQLKGGR